MKRNERNATIFILGLFILIPLIIIIKDGNFTVKDNKKFKFTISKPVDSEIKAKANKKEIVDSKIPSEKEIADAITTEFATTELLTTEESKYVSQDAVKKKFKNAKLLSMHTISNYASSQDS